MKKSRIITVVILPLLVIIIGVGFAIAMKDGDYSASDVLENANFNAENPSVSIQSIDYEKEGFYTEIKIPEETQRELIKAFKDAKFKEVTDLPSLDYDYHMKITLNTGYAMFLDSSKKSLYIQDTKKAYEIENDSDFFSILKQ